MSIHQRGLGRALILPTVGCALMIGAAYHPPFNGLDLLGWLLFIVGVMRFIRPVPRPIPRRQRTRKV